MCAWCSVLPLEKPRWEPPPGAVLAWGRVIRSVLLLLLAAVRSSLPLVPEGVPASPVGSGIFSVSCLGSCWLVIL